MTNLKNNNNKVLFYTILIFLTVIVMTVGYAAFSDQLTITDSVAHVRVYKLVRVNDVTTSSGLATDIDFSHHSIISTVSIPASDSITYSVTVTNLGNVPVALSNVSFTDNSGNPITGLTTNISQNNYIKICDNDVCTGPVSKTFDVTISNNSNATINGVVRVVLTFDELYTIDYEGDVIGEALKGTNFTYTFENNPPERLSISNGDYDSYTYTNNVLSIVNVESNISLIEAHTIIYNGENLGYVELGGTYTHTFESEWPATITIESGTYDNYTYNNHVLTITNVTSDISLIGTIGKVEITKVTFVSSKNVASHSTPEFDGMNVNFDVVFQREEGSSEEEFEIIYEVELSNTHYNNYIFRGFDFHPVINASASSDTAVLTLSTIGVENGDVIASETTKTFRVVLTLTTNNPDGSYSTETTTGVDATQDGGNEEEGTLTATITPDTGDLRSPNTLVPFTVKVTNTYASQREFRLLSSNSNLEIVDSNGNALTTLTVDGNSTDKEYTVYVKVSDGATFIQNTAPMTMFLSTEGVANTTVGSITFDVDVYDVKDTTKVTVGNAQLTYYYDTSDKKPKIKATWDRIDIGGTSVTDYVATIYTSDGTARKTVHTNSSSRSCLFDGMSENTNYYVIVYGIDQAENSGENYVSSATTDNGFATKSPEASFKWSYTVDTSDVNNLAVGGDGNTAILGATHTITVTASGSSYGIAYTAPESVTVTMNGSRLTSGTDYTYARTGSNNTVGTIVIKKVTGNISVSAERAGGCLVKGTKILLADGSYKNIEDIRYDDLLSVWNYDTGSITYTYPAFIENEVFVDSYLRTTFDDGTTLNTYAAHGVFSYDLNRYILTTDTDNYKVGSKIVKIENGKVKIVTIKKIETIYEDVFVYHIVSLGYFNVIADNVLTTDPNIMISNQYGFTKDIKWPNGTRANIINNKDNLYDYSLFSDIMPYYMFRALRVDEGKYVVDNGMITFELLKFYLASNPANSNYFRDLPMNENGKRLITVTTSLDEVNLYNKYKYVYEEGSYYILPYRSNVKCYLNTTNNTCYEVGSKVKVDTSTHFIAIYK